METSPVESEIDIVKLCDFGLSQELDCFGKFKVQVKSGTMGYMAPELQINNHVDSAIDMWSFGILLYELAVAYKPTAVKKYKYGDE